MTSTSQDGPIDEVMAEADRMAEQGYVCFQKFTCGKCGARQTIDEPFNFYARGECEKCHHVTPLDRCGIMAIQAPGRSAAEVTQFIRGILERKQQEQKEFRDIVEGSDKEQS